MTKKVFNCVGIRKYSICEKLREKSDKTQRDVMTGYTVTFFTLRITTNKV